MIDSKQNYKKKLLKHLSFPSSIILTISKNFDVRTAAFEWLSLSLTP